QLCDAPVMPVYSLLADVENPFSHFGHALKCVHAFRDALTGMHSVPAVVLPAHPPKYWFGAFAYRPHCVQLQWLPSGSVPAALHTRIGVLAPQSVPTDSDTKHDDEPAPVYLRRSFVQ